MTAQHPLVLLILFLVFGLASCGTIVETAANSAGLRSPAKIVADKSPPDLLVARDGTTCRVPERRFKAIRIGHTVTCVWSGESRPPGLGRRPPSAYPDRP